MFWVLANQGFSISAPLWNWRNHTEDESTLLFLLHLGNCKAQAQAALTQALSGSLWLLIFDCDSDPEPGLTLKSWRPPSP